MNLSYWPLFFCDKLHKHLTYFLFEWDKGGVNHTQKAPQMQVEAGLF